MDHPEDMALTTVEINVAPGPEYAERCRRWQGVPGIERAPNGRLWATWFSGGNTEDPFNHVVLVTSGDEGLTWSEPVLVIDPPGNIRAFDPVLWHDPLGRLWLFWAQCAHYDKTFDGRGGVWFIRCAQSGNARPTWSSPRRIAHGIMKNRPTVLSTGEWLFPCAVWSHKGPYRHSLPEEQFSNVMVSRDHGESFERLGSADVPNRDCDEHMIVEKRDGSLWMLVRVKDGIGEAVSHDRGRTWRASSSTILPGPCARFHIRRLRSGRLLLLNHFEFTGRSHLTALLSDDDGATWPHHLLLDERTDVSYPDAVETPEGRILMSYDRRRLGEGEILLQSFTEEDILLNRAPGHAGGRLRLISHVPRVNLGSGNARFDDDRLMDYMTHVERRRDDVGCRVADGGSFLHAAGTGGELALLPFRFVGSSLYLNFRASAAGCIRVELQDFMGRPLKDYALDDCRELRGDNLEGRVCWKRGHDVSALAGQLIRMRFAISDSDLFSFCFRLPDHDRPTDCSLRRSDAVSAARDGSHVA